MLLASTLLPASTNCFDAVFFAPWAAIIALLAELVVLSVAQRKTVGLLRLIPAFLLLKLAAWTLGFALVNQFPSGLTHTATQGVRYLVKTGQFDRLVILGYACAFAISLGVEYGGLRYLFRRQNFRRLLVSLIAVNCVGYGVLAVASRYFWR